MLAAGHFGRVEMPMLGQLRVVTSEVRFVVSLSSGVMVCQSSNTTYMQGARTHCIQTL